LRRHDSIDNSAYVKGKAPHSGGALVLKAAMIGEATKAEKELVDPLLQFRNWGELFPHNWSAVSNGADWRHHLTTKAIYPLSHRVFPPWYPYP
jgi:hypothetical protein